MTGSGEKTINGSLSKRKRHGVDKGVTVDGLCRMN